MIDTALRQIDHSILGLVGRGIYDIIRVGLEPSTDFKMVEIAQNIFSVFLLLHVHNFAVYSFALGFIFSDQVAWVANKVNTVILAQNTFFRRHVFVLGGVFLALKFLPSSMHVAALYLAANLGANLDISSRARLEQIQPQQQQ
jgi:hypothetical protein